VPDISIDVVEQAFAVELRTGMPSLGTLLAQLASTPLANIGTLTQHAALIGNSSGKPAEYTTGAKGRALLAMANDAALAAEIVARVAGQAIEPASIAAVGASGIQTRQADTQDGIRLLGRAGGTSNHVGTLTPGTLTASQTWTLPNATGTIPLREIANTWSAQQSFNSGTADAAPAAGMFGGEGQIARRIQIGYDFTNDIGRISNIHSATAWKPLAIRASNVRFEGSAGTEILRVIAEGLAIGATAISDGARLWAKGGSTPGAPATDEYRFGNGVGAFGLAMRSYGSAGLGAQVEVTTTGTINNLAQPNVSIIRFNIGSATTLNGLTGGYEGRIVFFYCLNSNLTIAHDAAGSTDINRFICQGSANIAVPANGIGVAVYGGSRWRVGRLAA